MDLEICMVSNCPQINSLYIEFGHKCKVILLPDNHDHTDLM